MGRAEAARSPSYPDGASYQIRERLMALQRLGTLAASKGHKAKSSHGMKSGRKDHKTKSDPGVKSDYAAKSDHKDHVAKSGHKDHMAKSGHLATKRYVDSQVQAAGNGGLK